jgi:hypothetical protein
MYWTDQYGQSLTGPFATSDAQNYIWVKLFDGSMTRCEIQTVIEALMADVNAMKVYAPAINIIGVFEVGGRESAE